MAKGLYVHIPFCDQICTYCDFPKLLTNEAFRPKYVTLLGKELELLQKEYDFSQLKTVYIGGGTPSALTTDQLLSVFEMIARYVSVEQLIEFSVEANPENLTEEKVALFKKWGVTRVSLGVQTFEPRLLNVVGRAHRETDVFEAVRLLKSAEIKHINLDLIYSIPGQTLADLASDLKKVQLLEVDHVSAYSLILEPHTSLYLDYMRDKLTLLDQDLEAQMYEFVRETLEKQGFSQYEISNYKKGEPSYHNQWYWQNVEYIGAGLGAHGNVLGVRYENTRSLTRYFKDLDQGKRPTVAKHKLSLKEVLEETLFLGLRLLEGVNLVAVSERLNVPVDVIYHDVLVMLIEKGWLQRCGPNIRLTDKGLMLANEVFEAFLLEDDVFEKKLNK